MIKQKIEKLAGLVFDLNMKTDQCWFLNIDGHIDSVAVYYGDPSIWIEKPDKSQDLHWITYGTSFSELDGLIEKLENILEKETT